LNRKAIAALLQLRMGLRVRRYDFAWHAQRSRVVVAIDKLPLEAFGGRKSRKLEILIEDLKKLSASAKQEPASDK
jgi:hypothetical protein